MSVSRRALPVSPKDSVANVSQIVSVDKDFLTARVGKLPLSKMELILSGIAVVPGKYSKTDRGVMKDW